MSDRKLKNYENFCFCFRYLTRLDSWVCCQLQPRWGVLGASVGYVHMRAQFHWIDPWKGKHQGMVCLQ